MRLHTMAFNVCFIYQIQTVFVTQCIPFIAVGVMASAYSIQVELFHQLNVFYHALYGDGTPMMRIVFMAVYSFKQYGYPIYQLHAVTHFHRTETERLCE